MDLARADSAVQLWNGWSGHGTTATVRGRHEGTAHANARRDAHQRSPEDPADRFEVDQREDQRQLDRSRGGQRSAGHGGRSAWMTSFIPSSRNYYSPRTDHA